MKHIINLRYLIDNKDFLTLDDLGNYYNFILDYKKCVRNQLKIENETTEAY